MGFFDFVEGTVGAGMDWLGEGNNAQWDPDRENFNLPGYGGMRDQYGDMLGRGPSSAPQMGQSGFRGDQRQLSDMLMNQARGQGPGQRIADMQASQQVDRGVQQQLSGARSARPGGSAMAARNAAMASGQLQGAGAQAATMGGLQAQQQATGQLGAVLQSARGADQNRALQNARLQFDTMGMDQNRQLELLRQQQDLAKAQQQGGQAYEQALGNKYVSDNQKPANWERALGAAQGLGQAYMQYKSLQGGQGGQQGPGQMNSNWSNSYGTPGYYGSAPQLQTGYGSTGGFGSGYGASNYTLGGTPLLNPYANDPNSGKNSGYALPKLK